MDGRPLEAFPGPYDANPMLFTGMKPRMTHFFADFFQEKREFDYSMELLHEREWTSHLYVCFSIVRFLFHDKNGSVYDVINNGVISFLVLP